MRSLAHTPDGAQLGLGRLDGTLVFVSTADYRTLGLQVDTVGRGALGFLDEGRILAIAGDDNVSHLWGVRAESPLALATTSVLVGSRSSDVIAVASADPVTVLSGPASGWAGSPTTPPRWP